MTSDICGSQTVSTRETVLTWSEACGVADPEYLYKVCSLYYDLLQERNAKLNLTRISSEADFWIKHVCDSLAIVKFFPKLKSENLKMLDLGCGAGFPSFVLAAAFPNLAITGVDSIGKKVEFAKFASEEIAVSSDWVVGRGRELSRKSEWRNKFDIITSRAVGESKSIFREIRGMLSESGEIILYKTPSQVISEVPEVEKTSLKYGFSWFSTEEFELPAKRGTRCFLCGRRKVA